MDCGVKGLFVDYIRGIKIDRKRNEQREYYTFFQTTSYVTSTELGKVEQQGPREGNK